MPDTGAPWNIPYVDPTDLVRDYPQASEDLADAIADGLDAASNAGIGSNLVQTVKTDTFSTTSTSYTNVTGLSAAITPTSTTSRILALLHISGSIQQQEGSGTVNVRLTDGTNTSEVGTSDGSRSQSSVAIARDATSNSNGVTHSAMAWLYTPGVATEVTITAQIFRGGTAGTAFVNRSPSDDNGAATTRTVSSLTLIEVAA
jgi:hypothetical protein